MLKTLLKIRLRALADSMFNRRRGKNGAGTGMKILMGFLLVYVVVVFGSLFGMMFYSMYEPFGMLGMNWLYYAMAGLMATGLCFIGSVFFTQSVIFEAKDNELLLSMPVKPSAILGSRMAVLLVLNYAYALLIFLACGVARCIAGPVTVLGVARYVLCALLLPLLPTTLSCVIGWLIALAVARIRNKTLFTTVLSLVFMGAYFAVCFNMQGYIEKLVANGAAIGHAIETALPPFYAMGLAVSTGSLWQLIRFALWCLAPFAVVYWLLSRSFTHIATMRRGTKKVKYAARPLRASSPCKAMFVKELRHLGSSSAYILNGCLGAFLCVAVAALCAVKGKGLLQSLADIYAGGADINNYLMPFACLVECLTLSMTIISAPSLSLEGKNMPLLQSMPVRARDVLLGKALVHMVVCMPAALVSSVLFMLALPMTAVQRALMVITPLVLVAFMALLGMVVNLRWPRFVYVNETVVIKQSASVTITMFSGMGVVLLPMLLYVLVLRKVMDVQTVLAIYTVLLAIACGVMYDYLTHRAERAFANLTRD